jgi:N,N-dimethylformamidase
MSQTLPGGFEKDVVGYCDPLSARVGEQIDFKLSSYTPGSAIVSVVQLVSGDDRPHGTGLIERELETDIDAGIELIEQPLVTGSYAYVENMPAAVSGDLSVWVYPTLVREQPQTILNMAGVSLWVSMAGFGLKSPASELSLQADIQERRWYHLRLAFGPSTEFTVQRLQAGVAETDGHWQVASDQGFALPAGDWYMAAGGPGQAHFNGRLEAPTLTCEGSTVACWDFSQQMASRHIIDSAGTHDGVLRQTPTRGVTGVHWDGSEQSHVSAPAHYAAIHFHEDDLTDAAWQTSLTWQIPVGTPSGQYALKVEQGGSQDYVPFFVRPARGQRTSDLLYLVPSASYLAYANQRLGFVGGIFGEPTLRHANDAFLYAHEDVGYSLYEYHRDHSGVHFSSRLRPILNLKPKTGTWAFNADTHITAWLDAVDAPFDVLTDEDLHVEGAEALQGYKTVITGTHPEYYSTGMRDALADWLGRGGRLMYMGGNGFYWRIAYDPENPAIIEVRRAEDGTRAWIANPGEYYQQFNGEYGGLWRRLGKPPNELVGIGFAAQGFDGGTYYRVQPGALDPRVSFIVDGVGSTDTWGDFGNQGRGAAGEEIDRFDESLGSPAHAVILASSENHKPGMLRVKEEFHMTEPLGNDAKVRADMVFFEVPGGGAVFSTGSISYAGSLAHNGYDNEIAKLTGNVLTRFLDPEPFDFPA